MLLCQCLDQRGNIAGVLDAPQPIRQHLGRIRAEDRSDEAHELCAQPGVVEGHDARAERLIRLAGEGAAGTRHRHPRRPQLRVEPIDLRRRRDADLAGNRRKFRIAANSRLEMLELDAAEFEREPEQIGEAQLGAGEIIPAGPGVLGGDAVGRNIDPLDLLGREVLVAQDADRALPPRAGYGGSRDRA